MFKNMSSKINTATRVLAFLLFFSSGLAFAQNSGSHYFGDADGNGIIEIQDLSTLATVIGNPGTNDSSVYEGHPQSRFRQELDGNGIIEIPDYSILYNWAAGDFSNNPGQAEVVLLEGETFYLGIGDSVTLSVIALSDDVVGRAIRTGMGVIFKISPSSTCTTAQFYGYDVNGGETINLWRNEKAYHYTTDPNSPDHGKATMKVNGNGCEDGQEVIIEVYIPDDVEANVTPGRFKAKLKADKEIKCTLDLIPPETTLESAPPILTNSKNADFSFSCNETPCTFECNLDSLGWEACPSPKSYTGLLDGAHSFQVRAKDKARNLDPTPETHNWIIDSNPPSTTITFGPTNPTKATSATFQFSCFGGPCTFECKLDSGIWEPCSSPKNYSSLIEGFHSFTVRAMDEAGNVEPVPPVYDWEIDLTPPDTFIDSYPPDPSNSNSPSFTFSCTGGPCAFECNLDSSGWESCTSPKVYSLLADGPHTFKVRATDLAGNTETLPPEYTWNIDTTAPDTNIDSQPANPTNQTSATFTFSCTGGPCNFECNLDSGGWGSCTSPKNYNSLSDGSHNFQVRASDLADNVDLTPANYDWTIDASPPDTFLDSYPPDPSSSNTATFTFSCTGGPCTFDCNLDSGGWSTCTSPKEYTALSEGLHNFQVRAKDALGNADASPASYGWTVANMPPDTFITSAPPAYTNTYSSDFSFNCSEGSCTYECKLDGASWGSCVSPKSYGNVPAWQATTTTGAPTARFNGWDNMELNAVWTGSEMIVWGGYNGTTHLNTGGRYNPTTDSWTATTTTNAPSARRQFPLVWTGTEMIVWGGHDGSTFVNTGGKYNPASDSWTSTSTTNTPLARNEHSAIWDGTDMIVWGGVSAGGYLNTGGRYNPQSDSWTSISITNAPSQRMGHIAVWTGSEMIVWGGYINSPEDVLNTGGKYNPSTNAWTATSLTNVPNKRAGHVGVWTGTEMIVWGGEYLDGSWQVLNSGGRYNPVDDSWVATQTTGAPAARTEPSAVWTGSEMIIWGGRGVSQTSPMNTGRRYSTSTNSWTATPTTNAPSARYMQAVVWTGSQMIVWGGYNGTSPLNTGAVLTMGVLEGLHTFYVRATDLQSQTDPTPAEHTWTVDRTPPKTVITDSPTNPDNSSEASFTFSCNETDCTFECNLDSSGWGSCDSPKNYTGLSEASHTFQVRSIDEAGNVDPTPASHTWTIVLNYWIETSTTNAPSARDHHNAFWIGTEMILWGGGFETGGRYDSSTDSWTATSTTNAPTGREFHAGVWTGTKMIVWGGDGCNTGGRYDPATDSWEATTTTNAPTGRSYHTAIWTGTEMIIWGGDIASREGGRYDPETDSWTATTISNAPAARIKHTAVWTETEMIVWGGSDGGINYATGGKYNPISDSWIATSTINAPVKRENHTAVWTGSTMIVWGGSSLTNTGGIYDPSADSWTATTTTDAPEARYFHTAVWNGIEMIVFGGFNDTSYLNTGGRYDPATDSWISTSTTNAPAVRFQHTAVWAGTEMIIWGGYSGSYLNTGGIYVP